MTGKHQGYVGIAANPFPLELPKSIDFAIISSYYESFRSISLNRLIRRVREQKKVLCVFNQERVLAI